MPLHPGLPMSSDPVRFWKRGNPGYFYHTNSITMKTRVLLGGLMLLCMVCLNSCKDDDENNVPITGVWTNTAGDFTLEFSTDNTYEFTSYGFVQETGTYSVSSSTLHLNASPTLISALCGAERNGKYTFSVTGNPPAYSL